MADRDKLTRKKQTIQIVAVVIAMTGAAAFGVWTLVSSRDGDGATTPAPSAASSAPIAVTSVAPPPAATSAAPEPLPPQYDGTDDFEDGHDHGGEVLEVEPPGFEATSDREAAPGDAAAAKAVLDSVIPKWAALDTSKVITPDQWVESWASMDGVSPEFAQRTLLGFDDLWSGVVLFDGSAKATAVTVDKELWNIGSHSLWRVTVRQDIVSNLDGTVEAHEALTWDFLVGQDDGGSTLVAYTPARAANEKPETFYLGPVI